MNANDLKKAYAKLPGKLIQAPSRKKVPYAGDPKDFVLDFGQHVGVALKDTPVSYLVWIVNNVTNRASTVAIVKSYLNGIPEKEHPSLQERLKRHSSASKPVVAGRPKGVEAIEGIPHIPAVNGEYVESSDIRFMPYQFPEFKHELADVTYEGVRLLEMKLRDLEEIAERYPDPRLKDFIACRVCFLYKFWVYSTYKKAVLIDVSRLMDGEAFQYEEILHVCRRITSILDSVADPEVAKNFLLSSQFDRAFAMKLPEQLANIS
jgi:hypothetical protein